MALQTTGEWYEITWAPTSGAAWAALATRPAIPTGVIDAVVDVVPLLIYVTNSATGAFVYSGGTAIGWDDTLISVNSGALTKNTWTDDNGTNYQYAIDSSGVVWWYDEPNQTLQSFPIAQSTAMKAFLP